MRGHTTIAMSKRHQIISLMLLLAVVLSGCAESGTNVIDEPPTPPVVVEEPTASEEPVSLLLACAPANANQAMTRLAEDVVQAGTTYRTINNFFFIGQKKDGSSVTFSDCEVDNREEPMDYTDASSNKYRYFHWRYCLFDKGVNACLVYAKADAATPSAGVPSKVHNGSLVPVFPTTITSATSPSEIRFSLEPILNATEARETGDGREAWETEVWDLADALTNIANVSSWATSGNTILKNLFENFTNHGYNLPGSAASVKQWMQALSTAAQSYINTPPSSIAEDETVMNILNDIQSAAATAANAITVTATSYPRNVHLPDGAAALRWAEVPTENPEVTVKKFVPQLETTTLDNINSVASFAYPPELYYFVDSPIKTSPNKMNYKTYTDEHSSTTWSQFLSLSDFTGTAVNTSTKTVIVTDPLQYAVAQLSLKVRASAEALTYTDGEATIPINDGNTTNYIRLTGVIVCGQRPVDYQFTQPDNMNSDVKFVYDSQVGDDFFLTTTAFSDAGAKELHSLVLQSYDGEDVNVILEFEYTGPTAFKCLNGYVYPNTRFYLVGEVKMEDVTPTDPSDIQDYETRVFTQDYTTTLNMTVSSLKKAYNVLPNILSQNLEVGVMTTTKWISATPQEAIIME